MIFTTKLKKVFMGGIVALLCFLILGTGTGTLFCADTPEAVMLERPSLERFETEFSVCVMSQRLASLKRFTKIGLIVSGLLAGGGYLAYRLIKDSKKENNQPVEQVELVEPVELVEQVEQEQPRRRIVRAEDGWWKFFKKAIVTGIGTAICITATKYFLDVLSWGLSSSGKLVKNAFAEVQEKFPEITSLVMRLDISLNRLRVALEELHKDDLSPLLKHHYRSEVVSSYQLFILTFERVAAIIMWQANQSDSNRKAIRLDCQTFIKRFFLLCNEAATNLETDLNSKEWNGFSVETIKSVGALGQVSFGFVGDYAAVSARKES